MSQAGRLNFTGDTPTVPTQFTTDNGIAVPVANNINIFTSQTNTDNNNGIESTGSGDTVTILLTNRITATITTTDATPTTLTSLSLGATPGVYIVEGDLTAYDVTDLAGGSYTFVAAAITTGLAGTEIGVENKNVFEQAAMATADFNVGVSGNDAFIQVIGIAGKTIHWNCLFTYRFVG